MKKKIVSLREIQQILQNALTHKKNLEDSETAKINNYFNNEADRQILRKTQRKTIETLLKNYIRLKADPHSDQKKVEIAKWKIIRRDTQGLPDRMDPIIEADWKAFQDKFRNNSLAFGKSIIDYKIEKCEAQIEKATLERKKDVLGRVFDISKIAVVTLALTVVTGLTVTTLAPFAASIAVASTFTGLFVGILGIGRTIHLAFYCKDVKIPVYDGFRVDKDAAAYLSTPLSNMEEEEEEV